MATVRDIITRSLRRLREVGAGQSVDADDAALAVDALNSMILNWASQGVDAKYAALGLNDTFAFFVPPVGATSEVIDALAYQGTWNASTNSPSLTAATGTKGHFYKVTTAGSTTLDLVTSWAVNDYAVYSGTEWLQSVNSSRFERVVIDLLAVELMPEFGQEPDAVLMRNASAGWRQIQAAYIKAPTAILDRTIMRTMSSARIEDILQ